MPDMSNHSRGSALLLSRLQSSLAQRREQQLLRTHLVRGNADQVTMSVDGEELLGFCSNDYLGLANHPDVIAALQKGARDYGVGSGASHLITGHCRVHDQLSEELAAFTGREKALLFCSGYMANVGVINALTEPDGLVLQDALNHASLLDGGWLSRGRSIRYAHSDTDSLELELRQAAAAPSRLIVTDGVFSMDGDRAPLALLAEIADEHRAALMVDDAHGLGVLGRNGSGTVSAAGLSQTQVPILIGTLGKAFGTAGAFVAGDAVLIDYLAQFARTYVFTTAMPPALAEATRASLKLVVGEQWRRDRLQQLISGFRRGAAELGLVLLPSETPVQAVMMGSAEAAVRASQLLRAQGVQVSAIRPPTVPQGQSRLRITLSAAHSDEQLYRLLHALESVQRQLFSMGQPAALTKAGQEVRI